MLSFGGDVMKFAGDSMIIAFSPSGVEKADLDEGLRASTLRCLQCASALAMQLGKSQKIMFGSHNSCSFQPILRRHIV